MTPAHPAPPSKKTARLKGCLAWLFRIGYRLLRFVVRRPLGWAALAVVLVGAALLLYPRVAGFSVETSGNIELTPEQIAQIEETRRWECLNVSLEEWVDTLRKGFFTDDRLARIYTGTLRIGIDLKRAPADWLTCSGDTATLRLPDVVLLNARFIDEARTRSFYESGTWKAEAKEAMYRTAHRRMVRRGMTRQNREKARQNAREQFTALFRTLGFRVVHVSFVTPTAERAVNKQ